IVLRGILAGLERSFLYPFTWLCTNGRVCTKSRGERTKPLPLPSLHLFCISGAPTVSGTEIIATYPPGGALSSYDIVVTIQLLIGRRSRGERHGPPKHD